MTPPRVARRGVKKAKSPRGCAVQPGVPPSPGTSVNTSGRASRPPDFPIIGIGASAGGLEAFETFFRHVMLPCGMAFVLVPHLDPDHPSILSEILQRVTPLKVVEAPDAVEVMPDHVYVIPPNHNMALVQGKLQLSSPSQPRGQRMPIDYFLRSLADERGAAAIGVVLSGTGADGSLGLSAIHSAGGVCMVQEPDTAKYDGMPQNAIQAGHATHILPVEQMPKTLYAITRRLAVQPSQPALSQNSSVVLSGLNPILQLIHHATGHDFSLYKKGTIGRRIERRMSEYNMDDIAIYTQYLEQHPAEVIRLFKELLINVTSFFRDPEAFAALRQVLVSTLVNKPEGYVFRVWVVGCASGEEAYSIAILLREVMDECRYRFKVQIYATDLDEEMIAIARAGMYPCNIEQDVPLQRRQRFFVQEASHYRVHKDIREMIIFAVHNVINDPPFTRLDLLSCRNLLIYLEPVLQNRLIVNFHYALKPHGVLFLSVSEGISSHPELFPPLSRKWKLFRAAETTVTHRALLPAALSSWQADWHDAANRHSVTVGADKSTGFSAAEVTHRALLQFYAPPSVLTDVQGNITFVHGDTGRYLRAPPGRATLNVVDMAKFDLQPVLRLAIAKAACDDASPQRRELSMKIDGGFSPVRFSLHKLPGAGVNGNMLLMSFEDISPPTESTAEKKSAEKYTADATEKVESTESTQARRRAEELERELAYHRETLQATIEAQQATNEELTSANEELQTTNEELETSREELNSLNEELTTVNAELNFKIAQLTAIQNDMKNLLDNVGVGVIFLDPRLNLRRFTPAAQKIYRVLDSDRGRPLADIKSDLRDDTLLEQARVVLETQKPYECEISAANDTCYLAHIQPYLTLDNEVDGVVMTFTDITKHVAAEFEVKLAREMAEGIINTVHEALVVLNSELKVVFASRTFYREFAVTPAETIGRQIYELGNQQWNIPSLRELLENILPQDRAFEGYLVEQDFPGIGKRKMLLNGRSILGKNGQRIFILLAMEDAAW
jgi:two-component system CheB/CheR fusion protein